MICKNCGYRVDGKFCSHCGQNSSVGRINLPNFLSEISESVFQINKGFFYTLKELFVRPGKSIKEFLNGKRKKHFKPIAYALTLSTLYFLIAQITNQNTWIDDILSGWMEGASDWETRKQAPVVLTWFAKNYAYTALLLLPVFSLASYLSFFRFGRNYLEHIVINSYITGHQAIAYASFAIVGTVIENNIIESIPIFVGIGYTFWVFWQFFSTGNPLANILRLMLTYFLYIIFSVGLLLVVMGVSEF